MYTKTFGKIDADVIVIGAGISGLTTAYTILKVDPALEVIVIEASGEFVYYAIEDPTKYIIIFIYSDRIGGRILSKPLKTNHETEDYDLGGQFVREDQSHLMHLLNDLGLELTKRSDQHGKIIVELETNKIIHCNENIYNYTSMMDRLEFTKFFGKVKHFTFILPRLNFYFD